MGGSPVSAVLSMDWWYATNMQEAKRSSIHFATMAVSPRAYIGAIPSIRAECSTHGRAAHATVLRTALHAKPRRLCNVTSHLPLIIPAGAAPGNCKDAPQHNRHDEQRIQPIHRSTKAVTCHRIVGRGLKGVLYTL